MPEVTLPMKAAFDFSLSIHFLYVTHCVEELFAVLPLHWRHSRMLMQFGYVPRQQDVRRW